LSRLIKGYYFTGKLSVA